jgi:chromosomal replication initiator protein
MEPDSNLSDPASHEPQSDTTPDNLWQRIGEVLRPRVGAEFDRWFGNLTAIANDSGEVIVQVPNPIHQLWIESNYSVALSDSVRDAVGGVRVIKFSVLDVIHDRVVKGDASELILSNNRQSDGMQRTAKTVAESARRPETLADAGISPRFSFDNFIVGPSTSYCAAVARAVAEKPGRIYNPLFFHSPPGMGKTHLLQAIGREIMYTRAKKAAVRYVTSEMFTNEFVEAIRKNTLSQFRQKYRKTDVLIIDDVQFLAGKDSTQEEFFHTFNDLFNNTKQIVMASDRPPADMKNLEARLVSRFEWGLATEIQMPDYETRVAILHRKAADAGATGLQPWVMEFIARRVSTDIRKLEGCLMRVAARVSIDDSQLQEAEVELMLRDVLDQEPGRSVNLDRLQRFVGEQYDIRMSELMGRGRTKMVAEARQVAMYLARTMGGLSLVDVGKAFGGRDHGTVIHAIKVINNRMDQSADFKGMVAALKAKVSAP